jgi:hypothetical protein
MIRNQIIKVVVIWRIGKEGIFFLSYCFKSVQNVVTQQTH